MGTLAISTNEAGGRKGEARKPDKRLPDIFAIIGVVVLVLCTCHGLDDQMIFPHMNAAYMVGAGLASFVAAGFLTVNALDVNAIISTWLKGLG